MADRTATPYIDPNLFDTAGLYNQEDSPAVITDYRIQHHYERDLGIYMLGIASPKGFQGASAAFIQTAAPTLLWIADWTAARFLQKPMVPDPNAVNSNWILMDVWLNPADIIVGQDGTTPLIRLTGTYIYGHQNPGSNFFSNVMFPVAPWFVSDGFASLRSISVEDLISLLEPAGVAGAGNPPPIGPTSVGDGGIIGKGLL